MVAGVTRTAASTMRWKTSSTLEQLTPATGAPSTNKKLRFCTNGCYYYYLLYLYCTQDKLFALLLTIPVLYTRSTIGTTTCYTCTVHKINYWHLRFCCHLHTLTPRTQAIFPSTESAITSCIRPSNLNIKRYTGKQHANAYYWRCTTGLPSFTKESRHKTVHHALLRQLTVSSPRIGTSSRRNKPYGTRIRSYLPGVPLAFCQATHMSTKKWSTSKKMPSAINLIPRYYISYDTYGHAAAVVQPLTSDVHTNCRNISMNIIHKTRRDKKKKKKRDRSNSPHDKAV